MVPLCLFGYYPRRGSRCHYSGLWLHTASPISGPCHVSVPSLPVNSLLWLHDNDVIYSLEMKLDLSSHTATRKLLIILLFYLSLYRSVYSNQASVLRFLSKAYLKVCTVSSNFLFIIVKLILVLNNGHIIFWLTFFWLLLLFTDTHYRTPDW